MFKYFHASPRDENVYKLLEDDNKKDETGVKSKTSRRNRYRSIHSAMVRKEVAENKTECKTMGVIQVPVETPSAFLKKHSKRPFSFRPASVPCYLPRNKECQVDESVKEETKGEVNEDKVKVGDQDDNGIIGVSNAQRKTYSRTCMTARKPPIPREPFELVIQDDKDFIKRNALEISAMRPKERIPRYVDTKVGLTRDWLQSGLAPQYIYRKNYTRVPKYLTKRKDELIALQKAEEDAQKEKPCLKELEPEERLKIIDGLKKNWSDVFTLYQSLPLLIDTPGKIKRKSSLEVELKRIEKDLQVIQRNGCIYVADVNHSFYIPAKR